MMMRVLLLLVILSDCFSKRTGIQLLDFEKGIIMELL
jgi:hypothetical protein